MSSSSKSAGAVLGVDRCSDTTTGANQAHPRPDRVRLAVKALIDAAQLAEQSVDMADALLEEAGDPKAMVLSTLLVRIAQLCNGGCSVLQDFPGERADELESLLFPRGADRMSVASTRAPMAAAPIQLHPAPALVQQAMAPAGSKQDRDTIRTKAAELVSSTEATATALAESDGVEELNRAHSGIFSAIERAGDLAESLRDLNLHHVADSARELEAVLRAAAEFSDVIDADRLATAERLATCAAQLASDLAVILEGDAQFVPAEGARQ